MQQLIASFLAAALLGATPAPSPRSPDFTSLADNEPLLAAEFAKYKEIRNPSRAYWQQFRKNYRDMTVLGVPEEVRQSALELVAYLIKAAYVPKDLSRFTRFMRYGSGLSSSDCAVTRYRYRNEVAFQLIQAPRIFTLVIRPTRGVDARNWPPREWARATLTKYIEWGDPIARRVLQEWSKLRYGWQSQERFNGLLSMSWASVMLTDGHVIIFEAARLWNDTDTKLQRSDWFNIRTPLATATRTRTRPSPTPPIGTPTATAGRYWRTPVPLCKLAPGDSVHLPRPTLEPTRTAATPRPGSFFSVPDSHVVVPPPFKAFHLYVLPAEDPGAWPLPSAEGVEYAGRQVPEEARREAFDWIRRVVRPAYVPRHLLRSSRFRSEPLPGADMAIDKVFTRYRVGDEVIVQFGQVWNTFDVALEFLADPYTGPDSGGGGPCPVARPAPGTAGKQAIDHWMWSKLQHYLRHGGELGTASEPEWFRKPYGWLVKLGGNFAGWYKSVPIQTTGRVIRVWGDKLLGPSTLPEMRMYGKWFWPPPTETPQPWERTPPPRLTPEAP